MALLPSDQYLAHMLGLTEEQFEYFKEEVRRQNAAAPQPAVVAGIDPITIGITIAIGIGLQVVANLIKPKPPTVDDRQRKQSTIKATTKGGEQISQNQRVAPRYGFDSTQEIATLGSVIPIVYANRETISETIGGETVNVIYGGVRTNCSLLWSQLQSFGGSQMLRGLFLVGEGPMAAIDPTNFASGGNALTSYDFGDATANEKGSRMTVYARYDDGLNARIVDTDRVYGRTNDPGSPAADNTFGIRVNQTVTSDFSAAQKPANQTVFGLYGFCGNDFGYRPNPTFEPIVSPQLQPYKDDGETKVTCVIDESKWAARRKQQPIYSCRSGITASNIDTIGEKTDYNLYSSSDKNTSFSRAIRELTTVGDWKITKELKVETAGTTFTVTETGSDDDKTAALSYEDRNNRTIDAVGQDLLDRFTAQIVEISPGPGVNPPDPNNWGYVAYSDSEINTTNEAKDILAIAVRVQFNKSGMSLSEIELLKASKFKVKLFNDVNKDDENDDVTVKQTHQFTVISDSNISFNFKPVESTLALTGGSVSTNADGVVTGVSFPSLTGDVTGGGSIDSAPVSNITYQWDRVPANDFANKYTLVSYINLKEVFSEGCEDIAASIAGRQKSWDDSLILGELYKIGSGLAVCTSRTAAPFNSTADSTTPKSVNVKFTTVRDGSVQVNSKADIVMNADAWYSAWKKGDAPPRNVGTTDGHIMRCAIASFSTSRPCTAVEIGIRSTLGIQISGLAAFNTLKNNTFCDNKACLDFKGNILDEGTNLYTINYRSNTISTKAERYSFFKIFYRAAGETAFKELKYYYGVRGSTSENMFNYLQLIMPQDDDDNDQPKIWEFQIEPLSGWEVRTVSNSDDSVPLYILEAGLSEQKITDPTTDAANNKALQVIFDGVEVPGTSDTFALSIGRRDTEDLDYEDLEKDSLFKYPESDERYPLKTGQTKQDLSLIDTWGKLAEAFIYDEVTSSAQNPEHEVLYVNEIVPNTKAPVYDDLALLGVNISSSVEWQQFAQFSAYVTGGKTCRQLLSSDAIGATHLLPDIVRDLMTNKVYGRGDLINDEMIKSPTFKEAAEFCQKRRYFYDGAVADQVNLRQWTADVAAMHLLNFCEVDGKFVLRLAMPYDLDDDGDDKEFNVPAEITGLYTAGNIKEGSFKLQYLPPEDREPIQVSVRYREERASTDLSNPGMFPVVRELLIREKDAGSDIERETLDMSDFCTNRQHAIDAAKFMIRMRRIPTHTIQFTTTHEGILSDTAPADYIRVAMDTTEYDELNNGIVTADGALISTQPMSGTKDAFVWDGTEGKAPSKGTVQVSSDGKTAVVKDADNKTLDGAVFTVDNSKSQTRTYQINSIKPSQDGLFTIDAVHMPTTAAGILEIAVGFDDDVNNWTIEG